MVFDGRCSNKNCSLRAATKPVTKRKSTVKAKAAGKSPDATKLSVKAANPRRASKCITYNLYEEDLNKESES